ncbi:MAG: hypothetical protein OEN21_18920 [Myxococcales bacterium]|nr:hypothetical protein [Myxococcales bacterium]
MTASGRIRVVQVLLTLTALEFFGPAIRDTGASHLLNSEWVGHARVHLMWLLGFMVSSGVANLYFIWRKRTPKLGDFHISFLWQGCNLLGFWIAVVLVKGYGGAIVDPRYHTAFFGVDENVFGFSILTTVYIVAFVYMKIRVAPLPRN